MKKIAAFCLTATLAAGIFVGCGDAVASSAVSSAPASSAASEPASAAASSAAESTGKDLAAVLAAVEAANPIDTPRELDDFALENDFGLTMSNIQEFAGKVSNTQGDSGTILVIHAAAGKAGDVQNELAAYQNAQINYYGNYAEFADGQANIKEGRIVVSGDYVVLTFASLEGADYAAIDAAIDEALS